MDMTVARVVPSSESPAVGLVWKPIRGSFTDNFLELKTRGENSKLAKVEGDRVVDEARDILGHCHAPSLSPGNTAVLVVGYVQSGKTLSFTSVAALARDNGYGIVVVLAGTTKNLKKQSEDRLDTDLGLTELQSAWTRIQNPEADDSDVRRIVEGWRRHNAGKALRDKPALLVTVLKHSGRIRSAAASLRKLGSVLDDVPALIIDDESDQASLNTKARQNLVQGTNAKSETYDAIVELRDALPHHSYLQYTATPQANLLLAISDVLNPSYAKVISSGASYTGGKFFFQDQAEGLIVRLPQKDVCDPKNMPDQAPESLQDALRFYLLGAAAAAATEDELGPGVARENRSMMVQASQDTAPHHIYAQWIRELTTSWAQLLRTGDEASRRLLKADFEAPYTSLQKSTESMSSTKYELQNLDLLLDWVAEICDEARIVEVNSKNAEKEINWKSDQFWILVGGMKLDRGFTVEGLTVTYMPRNLSENADVLQQRARFFGYRANYAAYCRIYLSPASVEAFTGYVRDEEYLRDTLTENAGRPLSEWRRSFLMSKRIKNLSRRNASGRRLKRLNLDYGWATPKDLHVDLTAVNENEHRMMAFVEKLRIGHQVELATSLPNTVDNRSEAPRNTLISGVRSDLILEFLLDMNVLSDRDKMLMTALTVGLSERDEQEVDIVLISDLSVSGHRGYKISTVQQNIFSGQNPKDSSGRALIYSGDRSFRSETRPTLQLRRLTINDSPLVENNLVVPWFSLHIPSPLAKDFVVEEF